MTISQWIKQATDELADNMFTSPRLDAEIILAHTIKHPRTYLHAHSDEQLEARHKEIADARIELRKDHVPIAYIIGHKEFYGRRFSVSPSVLIPRPESEQLITMLKTLLPNTVPMPNIATKRLVDIGTGSGCLGITAKLELPELDVALVDSSKFALRVAEKNARLLNADVEVFTSDLLAGYPYSPDIVLANLPYVDPTWERSAELAHEPADALFADHSGLSVIERCLEECQHRLKPGAVIILEADTRQLESIAILAKKYSYHEIARDSFAIAFKTN